MAAPPSPLLVGKCCCFLGAEAIVHVWSTFGTDDVIAGSSFLRVCVFIARCGSCTGSGISGA